MSDDDGVAAVIEALRILREAWVTGALEHPNVVPVHDVGGDASGASAAPPAGPSYCPDAGKTAPPGMQKDIDAHDLRQTGANLSKASPDQKNAALLAMMGTPGGATPTQQQAFWSGAGKGTAQSSTGSNWNNNATGSNFQD